MPVSEAAIEEAIVLNGVSVQMNSQAFRVGRLLVADPAWARTVVRRRLGAVEAAPELSAQARSLVDSVGAAGELKRLLEIRVPELIAYKNAGYARALRRVRAARARSRGRVRAGRVAPGRGGRALSLQAHGLQGRVRGGAPARSSRTSPARWPRSFPAA